MYTYIHAYIYTCVLTYVGVVSRVPLFLTTALHLAFLSTFEFKLLFEFEFKPLFEFEYLAALRPACELSPFEFKPFFEFEFAKVCSSLWFLVPGNIPGVLLAG